MKVSIAIKREGIICHIRLANASEVREIELDDEIVFVLMSNDLNRNPWLSNSWEDDLSLSSQNNKLINYH